MTARLKWATPSVALIFAATTLVAGCGGDDEASDAANNSANNSANNDLSGPTWHTDIKPILDKRCTGCHAEGAIGQDFARFDSYEESERYIEIGLSAISRGVMPPWSPAVDTCRPYQLERVIPQDEVDLLQAWVDAGKAEGDPADAVESDLPKHPREILGEPTIRTTIGGEFLPPDDEPDHHQCFVLPQTFDQETWFNLVDIIPGNDTIVHHVLLYQITAADVPTVQALDDADPSLGYSCFGGTGANGTTVLGAWVPGSVPIMLPEDAAFVLNAGNRIVVDLHYNVLSSDGNPDETAFEFWTLDTAPKEAIQLKAFREGQLDIPPGEERHLESATFTQRGDTTSRIIGVAPHMHLLGTETRMYLDKSEGGQECIIDIPKWDFDWQQVYRFAPGDEVLWEPGDTLHLECVYNNTMANQPSINGEQPAEPRTVRWGDGTLDEMCISYLMFIEPYQGAPEPTGELCSTFNECYADCAFGTTGCALYCSGLEGNACGSCLQTEFVACVRGDCQAELGAMATCLGDCNNNLTCVRDNCTEVVTALDTCAEPVIEAGQCSQLSEQCNIEL